MNYFFDVQLKAKNFKSFGEELQGFEGLKKINIIVGKNNSGKSALLDLVRYFTEHYDLTTFKHKGKDPELFFTKPFTEEEIKKIFPENISSGIGNHLEYGLRWLDRRITMRPEPHKEFESIFPGFDQEVIQQYVDIIGSKVINPLAGKTYIGISADRDIKSEGDESYFTHTTTPFPKIENGTGSTNIIQNFLNQETLERSLIEKDLLSELNNIFNPDITFKRLITRQAGNGGQWEISLEEEDKGFIKLSQSGSGLKTVILVLISTILLTRIHGKKFSDYIFAFEEIENNLHPGVIRRLLKYISKVALEKDCCFFLTTHSNVVIDFFSRDSEAQIIHVMHDGKTSVVKTITTFADKKHILDDLGFKASDLLQSNCVVWVEGPSDKIYFNKWIDLWTNGELKEGVHYQCVFYGGRLLSNLSASAADQTARVAILKVNTNAILLMDSDRKNVKDDISSTKTRIVKEVDSFSGVSWVTQGNEIENYIPIESLIKYYKNNTLQPVGLYEEFDEYLDLIKHGDGKKYLKDKVLFAETICGYLSKEVIEKTEDLKNKLNIVCAKIKEWNS